MKGIERADKLRSQMEENPFMDFAKVPCLNNNHAYTIHEIFGSFDCFLELGHGGMYPTFYSGQLIAIKKLKYKHILEWGQPYFVRFEGHFQAFGRPHPTDDPEVIIMKYDNENYAPITIKISSIKSIYTVKAAVVKY